MTLDTLTTPPSDPTVPKEWWTSLTLWFNLVSLVVAVAGAFTDPALASDPRVVSAAAAVVTVGNAVIRILRTSAPIAGTPIAAKAEQALIAKTLDAPSSS
jgi:hypothetical protein